MARALFVVLWLMTLFGLLHWWSPLQWLIVTLVLAGIRLGIAALLAKSVDDAYDA